jgi:hypothetical protein
VPFGQEEVVHEGAVGRLEERAPGQGAVQTDRDQAHARAEEAAAGVRIADHLARARIEFGVRGEAPLQSTRQGAAKVVVAA